MLDYVLGQYVGIVVFGGGGGDYYVGQVLNQTGGIRSYAYSTSS